jgi:hypothetical protein
MFRRIILIGAAGFLAGAAAVAAQRPTDGAAEPPDDAHLQALVRWAEMSTPGKHHARLDPLIGTWDQTLRFWHAPDEDAGEARTTTEYSWIMGGRFVQGTCRGVVMGMPFEGMEITGYDSFRGEYITLWIDTMATSFMTTRGTYDAAEGALIMRGEADDVVAGRRDEPIRARLRFVDEDTMVYELYGRAADGKEFRTLEIVSKRRE